MNKCENCKFYVQHYGFKQDEGIYKVVCGHCLKFRKLKSNCSDFVAESNNFKRVKSYNALTSLTKIEVQLKKIRIAIERDIKNVKQN